MSLINEALRRARQDVARREALTKGAPVPPLDPEPRLTGRPRSLALLIVAGTALGVVLVAAGALLVSGLRDAGRATAASQADAVLEGQSERGPIQAEDQAIDPSGQAAMAQQVEPPALQVESQTQPQVTPGSATAPTESQVMAPARDSEPLARGAGETTTTRSAVRTDRGAPETADENAVLTEFSAGEGAEPETRSEQEGAAELRFVHRAELPDGVTIELGGIAWSESGPFALLNRRVVGPGETVQGYRVVAIDRSRVELAANERTVYIDLK